MLTSKLTTKSQTTIPQPVRAALVVSGPDLQSRLGRVDAKTLRAVRRDLGAVLVLDAKPRAARRSAKR